jgi:hypothetical protein
VTAAGTRQVGAGPTPITRYGRLACGVVEILIGPEWRRSSIGSAGEPDRRLAGLRISNGTCCTTDDSECRHVPRRSSAVMVLFGRCHARCGNVSMSANRAGSTMAAKANPIWWVHSRRNPRRRRQPQKQRQAVGPERRPGREWRSTLFGAQTGWLPDDPRGDPQVAMKGSGRARKPPAQSTVGVQTECKRRGENRRPSANRGERIPADRRTVANHDGR